jgi:hypothetical protein
MRERSMRASTLQPEAGFRQTLQKRRSIRLKHREKGVFFNVCWLLLQGYNKSVNAKPGGTGDLRAWEAGTGTSDIPRSFIINHQSDRRTQNFADASEFDLAELGKGVFEGSPDCVKLLDAQGRIIAMNRNGLCAMEIDDFRAIRGANWSTLWTSDNQHAIEAAVIAARAGRNYSLNLACPTSKGASRCGT